MTKLNHNKASKFVNNNRFEKRRLSGFSKKSQKLNGHRVYSKINPLEILEKKCPRCGCILYIRNGKFGKFAGCINYPKCKYTENI